VIEILELVFERVKENKIMMPHPFKENLGVGCVTSVYTIFQRHNTCRNSNSETSNLEVTYDQPVP
jgi:hypothetical protein